MTRKFNVAVGLATASMLETASNDLRHGRPARVPRHPGAQPKESTMTRKITIALAPLAATVLGVGSVSACKRAPNSPLCQVGQENCEPTCITTSDGAGQPYTDGRGGERRWIEMRLRQQRMERVRATDEGRNHTADMASGGTRMANGITVSPFVPGSTQDRAWQAERNRRGLCGDDRRCQSAR